MGEYKQRIEILAEKIDDVADELERQRDKIRSYVSEMKALRDAIGSLEEKQS